MMQAANTTQQVGHLIAINWTFIVSTAIICLTILTGIIKVFGLARIKDEQLRKSDFLQELKEKGQKNAERIDDNQKIMSDMHTEVEKLKLTIKQNTEKIDDFKREQSRKIDELKNEQKELVARLDELLKQLLELTS